MEHNYLLNPGIRILVEQIERNSLEREVQLAWESILWTAFPAHDHWMTATKYKQGATEPDNKTSKIIQYHGGWAPIDVLIAELKRPRERIDMHSFKTIARDLLDDHLSESSNPSETTLFGLVGIGTHVVFYAKELPRGRLITTQERPLHIIDDAATVQANFDYFKLHVPQWPSPDAAPDPAPPRPGQSSLAYAASYSTAGTSYQADAPASTPGYYQAPAPGPSYEAPTPGYYQAPAPGPSYEASTPSYPAPASDYREGDNENTEGDPEKQQSDITEAGQYTTVQVRRERHMTKPDEFLFKDKTGRTRVTKREDWHKSTLNEQRCRVYHKYVSYQEIFRK